MPDNYDTLTRDQLISVLRKRDHQRRLGLVWERDVIEHEKALTDEVPLMVLDEGISQGKGPWENLLVEGDNFHALRFLGTAFKGQVKCIYIDPPYNTGNKDFIYNDRFVNKEDGWRMSKWMEFLYRRLTLARDLLRSDGVLLVSINDENRPYLELLLDQIWPGGRKGSLVWRSRSGDNSGKGANLSVNHEHVLVWANEGFRFRGDDKTYDNYSNPDNDSRGIWTKSDLTQPKNAEERPNGYYLLENPMTGIWYIPNFNRVWAYASKTRLKKGQESRKDPIEDLVAKKRVIFPENGKFIICKTSEDLIQTVKLGEGPVDGNGNQIIRTDGKGIPFDEIVGKKIGFGVPTFKRFASDLSDEVKPISSWIRPLAEKDREVEKDFISVSSGYTDEGSKEIRRVVGDAQFSYPKPPSLMRSLIEQSTKPDDIVMDFFAGSGTTGQAAGELGRRFILVSSTEASEDEPDKNICRDVAARRLTALKLNFAYLRTVLSPKETLGRDLVETVLWSSLQLLNAGTVTPGDSLTPTSTLETDSMVLILVRRLDKGILEKLTQVVIPPGKTGVLFTYQPGPIRQALANRVDIRVESLPGALWDPLVGGLK